MRFAVPAGVGDRAFAGVEAGVSPMVAGLPVRWDRPVNQPLRPEDVRASDTERELVQQWLHRAHADGSLDLAEFDAWVVRAWAAKTRGELAVLTVDLPTVRPARPAPPVTVRVTPEPVKISGGRKALKVLTTIWLAVSAFNFALWLLVGRRLGARGHLADDESPPLTTSGNP